MSDHYTLEEGGVDLRDDSPVEITLPLGALTALCVTLSLQAPCSGKCGNPGCEVLGYQLFNARRELARAFGDAAGTYDEVTLDVRAAGAARLAQWKADMVARGVW